MNAEYHILKAEWIKNHKKRDPILLKNPDAIKGGIRYNFNRDSKILRVVNN